MTAATALIAEDEPLLAAGLKADLARLWPELQVVAQAGDGAQALALALQHRPQLCFLDIRMPGMTGLEAAQAMAEDWPHDTPFPLLVFVTAYDQYALQAFEAQAVDYLVKPVDPARLAACVSRLQSRLQDRLARQTPADALQAAVDQLRGLIGSASSAGTTATANPPRMTVVPAQVGNVVHMVPVEQVVYFEAADKYVRVVTADREHLIRLPLKDLLPQLDPQAFWQVHRGTVVQARYIENAKREESGKVTLRLVGRSETLTASRLYAHLFKGL
jgi:DNA-binding LytR/AlgR family response regulator